MSTLRTALTLARKDWRLWTRDRTGMALALALPLLLCGVFGFLNKFLFGSGGSAFSKAALWVADEDASERSRAFIAQLRQAETISVHPDATDPALDSAALRTKLVDGEIHHGLVLRKGFAAAIDGGKLPTFLMLRDPDRKVEEQLISIGLMQATFVTLGPGFADVWTTRSLEAAGLPSEWHDQVAALSKTFSTTIHGWFERSAAERKAAEAATGAGREAPAGPKKDEQKDKDDKPFDLSRVVTGILPLENEDFRPPERPRQLTLMLAQSISGIGIMMLMFGLVACASLLLRERESGTLVRLLLAPSDRGAILWGKFLFTAAVGALQLAVLFSFGAFVFGVNPLRDFVTFVVVSISVLAAVTAFGMVIGTAARTQKQADGISTLVILVMSAVGGAWFPLQAFDVPLPLRVAMRCTLTHWAVSSYQAMFWNGVSWTAPEMLLNIAVLWGFAIAASIVARRLFFRRYVDA